jgi:hypothetical protein
MRDQDSSDWTVSVGPSAAFADTPHWVDAKKLVWPLIDQDTLRLVPPRRMGDDTGTRSWWQALLDVCVFGMGWTDVAAELTRWRHDGYPADTPLKRFVVANWGKTVGLLELYLYHHPSAGETIMVAAHRSRGWALDVWPEQASIDSQDLAALVHSVRLEARESDVGFAAEGLGFSPDADEDQWARVSGNGDGAHLSSHFSLEWLETKELTTLGDEDYVTLAPHLSQFSVAVYEGWYHKLHALREELLRDIENIDNVSKFQVLVGGLGSLGTFSFDEKLNCFVRVTEAAKPAIQTELPAAVMTSSPLYGFSVAPDMGLVLAKAYEDFDQWEDEPVEELELLVKSKIGLAHSFTYCVKVPTADGLEK